jgi:hypothetical protein
MAGAAQGATQERIRSQTEGKAPAWLVPQAAVQVQSAPVLVGPSVASMIVRTWS